MLNILQTIIENQTDAAVLLAGALTKGANRIAAEAQDYSISTIEANGALLQKHVTAKTPAELLELQASHAKAVYELSLSQSRKVGELVTGLSNDSLKAAITVSAVNRGASVKAPSGGHIAQAAE